MKTQPHSLTVQRLKSSCGSSSVPTGPCTHPVAAVQPLLHDANELLVAELVVAVLVEDLEDGVDQVVGQLDVRGHVDGAGELV